MRASMRSKKNRICTYRLESENGTRHKTEKYVALALLCTTKIHLNLCTRDGQMHLYKQKLSQQDLPSWTLASSPRTARTIRMHTFSS